jgi:O-antigen/teichoic acid export membrane protein
MAEKLASMWVRRGLPWAFGLADQGMWSVASFVLTLAAARTTGPAGLGAVGLGFAATLLTMGLARALFLDPFLAADARLGQRQGAAAVVTLSALWGAVGASACGLAGILVGGAAGAGLVAFAPLVPGVVVQDALRAAAYREGRTLDAAVARGAWIVTTVGLLAAGLRGSVSTVAAAWGLGAVPAALFLAWRLRCQPAGPVEALGLWRCQLGHLGRPLAGAAVLDGVASQIETYVAALVAGAAALGGFRAAVSAFAPLTVLRPALGQVGLPKVASAMDEDPRAAARRAGVLSGVLLAAALVYAAAVAAYGRLLPVIFGAAFGQYSDLLLPLTVSQIISAIGTGVHLYLLAAERGRVMLAGTAVAVPLRMGATAVLGAHLGAVGLAWAVVVGSLASLVVGLVGVVADARRWPRAPLVVAGGSDGHHC